MGWTYSFDTSGLTINSNAGQAAGAIGVALPPGGSASTAIPNVILEASTSALGTASSPADLFQNVPYSVTLTIADPAASQSHDFTFNGLINGSAAAGNFQIANAFTNSSQDSTCRRRRAPGASVSRSRSLTPAPRGRLRPRRPHPLPNPQAFCWLAWPSRRCF
jgi:hypothetical protein